MNNLARTLYIWLPPLVWMGIIFCLSSRQRIEISPVLTINFIFFKSLHVIEYAILYLLVFRTAYLTNRKKAETKTYLIAAVITFLYAVSDEVHQTLVPTREGKVRDVLIDTLGITLMFAYIKTHFAIVKKYFK